MRLTSTFPTWLILFVLVHLPLCSLIAQQNASFESWSPSGSPPPFDWKFPTGWTTNNATTEFISAGVTRNNYNHSGEFAARIKTLNLFGTLTRSQLALGNCQLDYPNYQLKAYTGGEALTMIPDEVSFYYQLTAGIPNEYAVVDVLIKRGNGSSLPDTIYYASMPLSAVDVYTQVKMNIPDVSINTSTDSIVILFSSNDTNEMAANILFVDDVVIDFVNDIQPVPPSAKDIILYPNPVQPGELLTLQRQESDPGVLQIFDENGRLLKSCFHAGTSSEDLQIQTPELQPGLYFIHAGLSSFPFVVKGEH